MKSKISSTNTQAFIGSKALKAIRCVFHLLKNVISNANLLLDLPLILKRGNKLAGKAFESLLLAFFRTSRNDVTLTFPAFKEYEFSCSNTPAFQLIPAKFRRRHNLDRRRSHYRVDDAVVAAAVQRAFEMLNRESEVDGTGSTVATPMILPGFGKSPAVPVRQLRVTDSPFPVKENAEESNQVSKAAEEFIRKFYMDLIKEKSFESPYRHIH